MQRARLGSGISSALAILSTLLVPACGAHLHRPGDAEAAEHAQAELKGARLTDGFAPELAQAAAMLTQELEVARAWAQKGRDRDLLDVLSATAVDENDPDTEILLHPRCRGRFKGDGWSTLCSKLSRRIAELGGLTVPASIAAPEPVKPAGRARKDLIKAAPAGPDPMLDLLGELRRQQRAWQGPQSDASRLARAATDYVVTARAAGVAPGSSAAPRCPVAPRPPGLPSTADVTAEAARLQGLCIDHRRNLEALVTAPCGGAADCKGGRIATGAAEALAVYDALAAYDTELARRLEVYTAARRPCDAAGTDPTKHVLASTATRPSGQVAATPAHATSPTVCDAAQVQRAFAALAEIPVPARLEPGTYEVLARQGRVIQLAEQLAALDELVESRESKPKPGAKRPASAAPPLSPELAEALHGTIAGIQRVEAVVDAFELAVLSLIRETLRVEHAALTAAIGHAERRRRIELARLTAMLEEYALVVAAFADLQRIERAGCAARPIVDAHKEGCRDETTRLLLAYSNSWTLGRAAQAQADVLDLGVRHEASIDRSRAAMAVREVYLAAGIAELAKFNRGGIRPEALAQIIVSAVGFGVVAGGVY